VEVSAHIDRPQDRAWAGLGAPFTWGLTRRPNDPREHARQRRCVVRFSALETGARLEGRLRQPQQRRHNLPIGLAAADRK
jgi:hypothetical protein